jgi:glycosyltransferase involved in cell wall biosynthesis
VARSGGALLVKIRRPDLLASRLEELLMDPEKRHAMGKANRRWFSEHFTVDRYRRNMESAILDMLER